MGVIKDIEYIYAFGDIRDFIILFINGVSACY